MSLYPHDKSITFGGDMRIYLVGFMGSGKSTLGKRTARTLDVPFFDTDSVVESQSGKSISEIFEVFGEHHFREMETDVLKQTSFYPKSINATGGGLPCFNGNMDWMKKEGITIYLQWPDEMLMEHLHHHTIDRPLLKGMNILERAEFVYDLLQTRKVVYEQAAISLEMSGDLEKDIHLLEKACKYIW